MKASEHKCSFNINNYFKLFNLEKIKKQTKSWCFSKKKSSEEAAVRRLNSFSKHESCKKQATFYLTVTTNCRVRFSAKTAFVWWWISGAWHCKLFRNLFGTKNNSLKVFFFEIISNKHTLHYLESLINVLMIYSFLDFFSYIILVWKPTVLIVITYITILKFLQWIL